MGEKLAADIQATRASEAMTGERYIITGPPGSGKTTWVQKYAREGDFVWDMDTAADLFFRQPKYPRPAFTVDVLTAMRDAAIFQLRRQGEANVFIIVTDGDTARKVAGIVQGRIVECPIVAPPQPRPDLPRGATTSLEEKLR